MPKPKSKSKKNGSSRNVKKIIPKQKQDAFTPEKIEEIQEANEDFEEDMSNVFKDFLSSPPSSPAPLQLADLMPSPEMKISSPDNHQVSAPLSFLPESRLHPNITQRRKSIKVIPEEKFISILIIGHGSVIGSEQLFFISKPDCVTKYIVPFGNNAYLSPYADKTGLEALGSEVDFTDITKEDFKNYMNNLSNDVIDIIYDQKTKTIINKEPMNYARLRKVNSAMQLNKLYKFYDDENDFNDPFNTYGVYILHNNMGIAKKTNITDILSPDTSYSEIINALTDKYGLDEKSLIYTIDTTCNPVLYESQKQSARADRTRRAYVREIENVIDGNNRGDPNTKFVPYYIYSLLRGGKKRHYTRKIKK